MLKRKMLLPTLAFIFITTCLFAQATVTSTTIEKVKRNAVMISIEQSVDITTAALEERMKRSGLSGKSHHHVTSYKEVVLPEITSSKVDIYTSVEEGKNKNSSIVYMSVSKGYDNFTDDSSDGIITDNIKTFLNSFVKEADAFSLDLLIASQAEEVSIGEKDYEQSLNDQKDLKKEKTEVESNISDKEKKIAKKKEDLDRKKQALEELKLKRDGLN